MKSHFNYNGQEVQVEWHDEVDFSNLKNVTQVYGVIFNDEGKILIVKVNGKWSLPGGTPEGHDKSPKETLVRETIEEVDVEIDNIKPLGYQNSSFVNEPNSEHQQLRYFAIVKKVLPQTPDPDPKVNLINERKFINPEKFSNYCNWGEIGNLIIKKAVREFRSSNPNPYIP